MAPRTVNSSGLLVSWTWSAILAGVLTSKVVQILLTMLGFGVGLLSVDVASASEARPRPPATSPSRGGRCPA